MNGVVANGVPNRASDGATHLGARACFLGLFGSSRAFCLCCVAVCARSGCRMRPVCEMVGERRKSKDRAAACMRPHMLEKHTVSWQPAQHYTRHLPSDIHRPAPLPRVLPSAIVRRRGRRGGVAVREVASGAGVQASVHGSLSRGSCGHSTPRGSRCPLKANFDVKLSLTWETWFVRANDPALSRGGACRRWTGSPRHDRDIVAEREAHTKLVFLSYTRTRATP